MKKKFGKGAAFKQETSQEEEQGFVSEPLPEEASKCRCSGSR